MSNYIQIFVETAQSIDEFAVELSRFSGSQLERCKENEDVWYSFESDELVGGFRRNEFGDDDDLPLARYTFEINVRSIQLTGVSPQIAERWRDDFLDRTYDALKASRRYPILMVDGLAYAIKGFDPHKSTQTST